MLRRLLSLPRDAAYLLLTHRVRCCILLTHTLTHGSCISVMSDVKVREERVNATLGVNPQFLSHEQVCIISMISPTATPMAQKKCFDVSFKQKAIECACRSLGLPYGRTN